MSYTIHTCEQRSSEWQALRLGRVTSSRAADMLAMLKSGGEGAGRRNYRVDLVLERITGKAQENGFTSKDLQRGIEREPEALLRYEALTGALVRRTGFLSHDSLMAGASLDGDIDDCAGIVEAKCPKPAVHLDYLRSKKIPGNYFSQILHAMWVTGAQWGDFLSYCPEFPAPLDVCLVRVERNAAEIDSYELALRMFLKEVDAEVEAVKGLMAA